MTTNSVMAATTKTSVGIFIFSACIIIMLILSTTLVLTHSYFLEATTPSARKFHFQEAHEGVTVTWQKPSKIYDDNLGYEVIYNSTIGNYSIITEFENITISTDTFCYFFDIQVATLPTLYRQLIGNTRYYETVNNVEDLQLMPAEEDSMIVVTWSNDPLQQQCNLSYEVNIESGDNFETITVYESSVIFDLIYCVNITVDVKTIYDNKKSLGSFCTYKEVYPTLLEPVTNVSITTATSTTAVLSWEIPKYFNLCSDLYTVTAKNEKTKKQSECQGLTGCEVTLHTFCPYTEFIIGPTLPFEGDKIELRYSCAENGFV